MASPLPHSAAADHTGSDARGRELITVKDGNWTLVK